MTTLDDIKVDNDGHMAHLACHYFLIIFFFLYSTHIKTTNTVLQVYFFIHKSLIRQQLHSTGTVFLACGDVQRDGVWSNKKLTLVPRTWFIKIVRKKKLLVAFFYKKNPRYM